MAVRYNVYMDVLSRWADPKEMEVVETDKVEYTSEAMLEFLERG